MQRNRSFTILIFLVFLNLRAGTDPVQADRAAQNQRQAQATLQQTIAALGGKAYLSVEDAESEGRTGVFFHQKSEGSTEFRRYWQWPDKERLELGKQREVARLTLGGEMYEITFRGARLIDPEKDNEARVYLEGRRLALEVILRQWLNAPGIALFDEGQTLAENHNVERITLIAANNDAVTLSIDNNTHLPVKKSFVIRDPQGYRDEIAEIYDNWKMVEGINTPFNVLVTANGDPRRQYFINSISYNRKLSDSLFAPFHPSPDK